MLTKRNNLLRLSDKHELAERKVIFQCINNTLPLNGLTELVTEKHYLRRHGLKHTHIQTKKHSNRLRNKHTDRLLNLRQFVNGNKIMQSATG